MNYLCAVLLLAFAAGSVHSHFRTSPEYYQPEFEETFKQQCVAHFPISMPSLSLLNPVTSALGSSLSTVTGVEFIMLDASVSLDSYKIDAGISSVLSCDSFPDLGIKMNISVNLKTYLEDGCSLLGLLSGPSVKLYTSGPTLNLDKPLIDEVLMSATPFVTDHVEDILDDTLLKLNYGAMSFSSVQIIGGKPYNYEIREAEIVDGVIKGVCCLLTEEGSECSENVDVGLTEDGHSIVTMTNGILSILKTVTSDLTYQVQVPDKMWGDLAINVQVPDKMWGDLAINDGSPMNLRVRFTGIEPSFTPNGVDASASLRVELLKDTDWIISANTNLDLTAKIDHKYGHWGFTFEASPSADLELEMEEDTCDCWDSISSWLPEYLTCNVNGIIEVLNAHVNLCLKVPNIGGLPYTNLDITPDQNSCKFKFF